MMIIIIIIIIEESMAALAAGWATNSDPSWWTRDTLHNEASNAIGCRCIFQRTFQGGNYYISGQFNSVELELSWWCLRCCHVYGVTNQAADKRGLFTRRRRRRRRLWIEFHVMKWFNAGADWSDSIDDGTIAEVNGGKGGKIDGVIRARGRLNCGKERRFRSFNCFVFIFQLFSKVRPLITHRVKKKAAEEKVWKHN